jgi:Mn2+/Fe2+ NRAMP family transporter
VSGLHLLTGITLWPLTVLVTAAATLVLWTGRREWISTIMIVLVGCMGIAFITLALTQASFDEGVSQIGILIPDGSELLVLGLVGTTIVPYNIFIGSGISRGQTIPLMRIGLLVSILIGGLITMAIVVAGTAVQDFESFEVLAQTLRSKLGGWAFFALALGLFAAGFSSSITSPYASSVIAGNVFGMKNNSYVRTTWGLVMLTGFCFGISGIKPIPVILTVQALNGFILPMITLFLVLIVNDTRIVKQEDQHRTWYNIVLLVILFVMLLIGLNNVDRVLVSVLGLTSNHFAIVLAVSLVATIFTALSLFKKSSS